ncbi:unnamed protein product [Tuber aestivum]|uniref:Uncharacterized protein n=1 Tax=Tuber aestivum TaxID=59557 RepID=A0A292PS95_9PEZI|nr:unnamed protein product [Tuber aestivum]
MARFLMSLASFPARTLLFSRSPGVIVSHNQQRAMTADLSLGSGPETDLRRQREALHKIEAKWHKRLQKRPPGSGLRARLLRHGEALDKLEAEWHQHLQKQQQDNEKEMEKQTAENNQLHGFLLREKKEKLRQEGKFNIRGALAAEHIVYQARMENQIPREMVRVEVGLCALADRDDFAVLVRQEVLARGLVLRDVMGCAHTLYKVSERASGNDDSKIIIRASEFTSDERAAMVTFMKLQGGWRRALDWVEDEADKQRV